MSWVKTDWLVSSKTLEVSVAVIDVGGIIVWAGGVIIVIVSIFGSGRFLGKILSSPDDNNILVAWDLNIFLSNWHLMVVMLVMVLNLNLVSISWVHMSKVLFIVSFLTWDILTLVLNKMMLLVVLNLNFIGIGWVHASMVLFIIFFLAWDVLTLNKMMSWSLVPLCIIWMMWVHFFIVFIIILLWGGVRSGNRLRLALLSESTVSIEVSHFVGDFMMLLLLLSILSFSFLVTDDLF